MKYFAPLINSHVDSRLFKAAPNFNQPLLQFVDGVDFPLVYRTLHDSTDHVINWIEIWTVWRPQIWRNEVWCFSTQNLHSFTRTNTISVSSRETVLVRVSVKLALVLVLQGNVATKLSYSGKFFILVMSHFFLIPTFAKVTVKIKVAPFFDSRCRVYLLLLLYIYCNCNCSLTVTVIKID